MNIWKLLFALLKQMTIVSFRLFLLAVFTFFKLVEAVSKIMLKILERILEH